VLLDQVEHPLLYVRPDGAPGRRVVAVLVGSAASREVELGHVLDRDDDPQFDALGAGRLHDGDRAGPAEERGDLLDRPHRRGQPDPLRGPPSAYTERVEALQGQGQVRAALIPRDGVHLVEDDRFHSAQGLPGLRGKQQEERLRRGDEDVGRLGDQLPAFLGGGVAGADRDPDVRLVQAQPLRGLPDPGQRRPEVPLDVHGQGLERGDVEHPAAVLGVRGRRQRRQLVDRPQERGQRLARPGRRDDQRVLALADRAPGSRLSLCRLGERSVEPCPGRGREPVQGIAPVQRCLYCHAPIVP
jgi:hypothetical protein